MHPVTERVIQMEQKKYTMISLGANFEKEDGEKIKARLHGKSYMNFEVLVCPVGGSFEIFVQTDYEESRVEILEFLVGLMACELVG